MPFSKITDLLNRAVEPVRKPNNIYQLIKKSDFTLVLTRFSRKVFSIVDIFVPRIASSFSSVVVVGSEGKGDTPKEKKKTILRGPPVQRSRHGWP